MLGIAYGEGLLVHFCLWVLYYIGRIAMSCRRPWIQGSYEP